MSGSDSTDIEKLEKLIVEAKASGGSESGNDQIFIERLCIALKLPVPDMGKQENELNDYVFQRRVDFKHPDGSRSRGFIDCYNRGKFVLEAKQSTKRQAKRADAEQLRLLPEDATQTKFGHARTGTRGWDQVMLAARNQAEGYARALPAEHGYPPFLLIVDIGNVIEVYADFSGLGKDYAHFPDRRSYRIAMDDLREGDIQARLKAIWTDPQALNPAKRSAEVTSDIAARLARIAKALEGKHDPKDVAEFLMRCLFTMFAEDVELIPAKSFENLLKELKDKPAAFVPALENLWKTMDEGGYDPRMVTTLKKFNGSLFKKRTALPLEPDQIHELYAAAQRTWQDVEPAIFGTLLERALDSRERSKLGAHYTPRAYVVRLVIPTIIEPLRADWEEVKAQVEDQRKSGDMDGALKTIKTFHHTLCTTRVLDPACGTGNFLYVALELMKKLEGEVLEALDAFGEEQSRFVMEGETVSPRQFYGLELNPRAVPVADLVLWIGYLKWQLKTTGLASITEPVLHAFGTIQEQDAVLAFDKKELRRDERGKPISVWDGRSMRSHPISGQLVPDDDQRVETYTYRNPRPAKWPKADFIVGNPPFIGKGAEMRQRLGDGYVEAIRKAHPLVPGNCDFVMYWWHIALDKIENSEAKGAGLIATNSIKQIFNRQVLSRKIQTDAGIYIDWAIPDHPWVDESTSAAVRIAMMVARQGNKKGRLLVVNKETANSDGSFQCDFDYYLGEISAAFKIGAQLIDNRLLKSNSELASMGPALGGRGFLLKTIDAERLIKGNKYLSDVIKKLYNPSDFIYKWRGFYVPDLERITSETELASLSPDLYQHLLNGIKLVRQTNRDKKLSGNWWKFRRSNELYRSFSKEIGTFFVTPETAKHRFFISQPTDILVEHGSIAFGTTDTAILGIVSSQLHTRLGLVSGGFLGPTPRYNKTRIFDVFPFPACISDQSNPALRQRLSELAERLDAFRKERLAAHDFLTMTALYNVLERVRELENKCDVEPLSPSDRDIYDAGLISILKEIHDGIDRAVFEAYGWQDLGERLIGRPGATVPSVHKSEDQEQAEEELLTRLVALNLERQEEEKRGLVRWLRPDYQIAKLGAKVAKPTGEEQLEADVGVISVDIKPKWPSDGLQQIRIVRDVLAKAVSPAAPDEISLAFDGRNSPARKDRVRQVLETLVATGAARTADEGGRSRYFVAR